MDLASFEVAIKSRYPKEWGLAHMNPDDLLAHWWVFSQLSEDDLKVASKSMTRPKDGGVDAVVIDDSARVVHLIQAKFRGDLKHLEKETDFNHLTQWGANFALDDTGFTASLAGLSAVTKDLLGQARDAVASGFELSYEFVSTGRISQGAAGRQLPSFVFIGGKRLLSLYEDFAAGVQPVTTVSIPVAPSNAELADASGVELAVFLVGGKSIRQLAHDYPTRIFARNIRGFLGESSPVNTAIISTIKKEPERFRYMNNGLTVVCDRSVVAVESGQRILTLHNPQIVNGQQTSRSLARTTAAESSGVDVLVKVVRIDREKVTSEEYDRLVREIVEATNRQSSIAVADLRSNDKRQVDLYRAMARLGYYYARKSGSYGEYQLKAGGRPIVARPQMADAVANSLVESLAHRFTKQTLYQDPHYELIFDPSQAQRNLVCWYVWRMVLSRTKKASAGVIRDQGKWLTQFHLWEQAWPALSGRTLKFLEKAKAGGADADVFVTLAELADATSMAVEAFFPSAAKARGLVGDPVRLFKIAGLDPDLHAFLGSSKGLVHKRRMERRAEEFKDAVNA